jgi:hypothetical protein
MQMVNIFEKLITTSDYFSNLEKYLKLDLYYYLNNNLYIENYVTFYRDLETALKINANE